MVYIVYFLILIYLDLHAKSDEQQSEVETFDVGQMVEEEQSIVVTESESGFNVGGNEYEVSVSPNTPSETEAPVKAEKTQQEKEAELSARMKDKLATNVPIHSDGYERDEFVKKMVENQGVFSAKPNHKPDMRWTPVREGKAIENM